MMGARAVMQEALFYSFSLEDHVPQSHLLRAVDRFVDLNGIREKLRPFYSETRRPSIDPDLMIRMLPLVIALASGQNGASARKCILILPIAGFAASALTERCRIIRRSPRTATAAFGIAICCGTCSR
ncbi:hypothetical protein EP837_02827 [Sphingobium sp. EP60837]|nr:hypothetical protein EP837_02827 [Sphingobium sp. EP60837]